jgi:GTPase SAR1 family protein
LPLSSNLKEILMQYVRDDRPFGPPEAADIEEPEAAAALFDWYNRAFAQLLRGTHVIVGRRGAGKSSLLRTYKGKKFLNKELVGEVAQDYRKRHNLPLKTLMALPDIVVDVDTPELVDELEVYCVNRGVVPGVEMLAGIWTKRIWLLIGETIKKEHVLLWHGLPDNVRHYIERVDILNKSEAERSTITADTPKEFIENLRNFMNEKQVVSVVTFDNVERHKFEEIQNAVFAGLCAAVGKLKNARKSQLDVKLCLPAETFETLSQFLFRADKDMPTIQYLHWNAEELMHVAAHRMRVYLEIYSPGALQNETNLPSRVAVRQFWQRYMPEKLVNSVGIEEDVSTYLLRHTQMLPRQLLSILNNVATARHREGPIDHFKGEDIVAGVSKSEETHKNAVLNMYQPLFPLIHDLFTLVMPRLSCVVSYGELQSVWHSRAKLLMREMKKPDFIQFWRLMISTGALGLVDEAERSDIYVVGRFEYNTDIPVRVSDKDRLCVHPMFSRVYNVLRHETDKLVLPRGSDFRIADKADQ